MEIIFILSGEHETLPKAEISACLKAENISFKTKYYNEGILILKIAEKDYKIIDALGKKIAYTHEICKLLFESDRTNIDSDTAKYQWENIISDDYAVRVKKIGFDPNFNSQSMEIKIGGIIKKVLGTKGRVNLENPATFLRTIVINDKILVSERLVKRDKKHYYNIKPHKRPFFYPGSMSPKLARGMNNLARVKQGSVVLDPFCGTGGILIEAGISGAKIVGIDIDEKMVEGTKKNLEYCNIKDYDVFQGDARKINIPYKVDAIVTDPPYGISASTAGDESKNIYKATLSSMENIIKDDGYICMATPHYLDINALASHTKFKIIEQYEIRMHKSLTRVVSVLNKH
ncbi:MAG: TIGR01177 family methyltransferase [Methanobacterium sp.]|uniref:TIGR01177 family methyltransferase n=1 Tax=Methanobacterium sp. TaxID=2164 RepID=UPI003D652246|nr:TIGR01177 family methyltransferase [Methanobacterium sp.]